MSAIGDYVHLYRAHYEESGTNRLDHGRYVAYNFGAQKQRIKERMRNNASALTDEQILEMRTNLSYILSTDNGNAVVAGQKVSDIQTDIAQILTNRWKDRMGNIDFDTGNITAQSIANKRDETLTYIGKVKEEKNRYFNTVYERVTKIANSINEIKSPVEQKKIQDQIDKIKERLAELFKTTEAGLEALSGTKVTFKQTSATSEEIGSMVADLNEIIKVMGATPPINLQKGDFFEYAIAALGGKIKADAEDGIYTAMTQVVGSNKEAVKIDMDRFSEHFDPKSIGIKASLDNNGNTITIGESQGKVDVIFELSDGNTAKISAKNVNLSSGFGVHVLSNSSLLTLLQDQDSDFVNHYLNLAAWHPDSIGGLGPQLMAAREAVKMTILWQAVSGDVNGRQTADTFIINDNSKTGIDSIQVYDIPKLVEKAWENLDAFATITSSTGKTIDNLTFYNKRSSVSYSDRISTLLGDVRAQKLSVAISPLTFNAD